MLEANSNSQQKHDANIIRKATRQQPRHNELRGKIQKLK